MPRKPRRKADIANSARARDLEQQRDMVCAERDKAQAEAKALRESMPPAVGWKAVADILRTERDDALKDAKAWRAAWLNMQQRVYELRQALTAGCRQRAPVGIMAWAAADLGPCRGNSNVRHDGPCGICWNCQTCQYSCTCIRT